MATSPTPSEVLPDSPSVYEPLQQITRDDDDGLVQPTSGKDDEEKMLLDNSQITVDVVEVDAPPSTVYLVTLVTLFVAFSVMNSVSRKFMYNAFGTRYGNTLSTIYSMFVLSSVLSRAVA